MSITYSADQTVLVNGVRTTFPRDNQNHSVAMIAGYDATGNVVLGTFNDMGELNVSATLEGTVTVGDVTIQATLANGQIFPLGEILNPDETTYSLFVQDPRAAYTGSSLNVNVTNAETGNVGILNASSVRINPATNEVVSAISAQLPASLGAKTSAASLATVLATDQAPLPVTQSGSWTVSLASETIMIGQVELVNGSNIAAVSAAGALKVDGSAVTQPVSGTVAVSNFPATQAVTLPVDVAPATQNITAADVASVTTVGYNGQNIYTGAPTANSIASFAISAETSVRVQVSGVWVGTLSSEASEDGGTTWYQITVHTPTVQTPTSIFTGNLSAACLTSGFTNFRIRATAWTSGTATVKIVETVNPGVIYIAGAVNRSGSILNTNQVTVANTATLILAANPNRKRLVLVNTGSTTMFFGGSTVTAATGQMLLGTPGYPLPIYFQGAVYGITAVGTAVISYQEEA